MPMTHVPKIGARKPVP